MPTVPIEMFDTPPTVGDRVTVTGTVESINEERGEVEISYESVAMAEGEAPTGAETVDESLDRFMRRARARAGTIPDATPPAAVPGRAPRGGIIGE